MDYKKELDKIRKHRKSYFPAVSMLMDLHDDAGRHDAAIELINDRRALVILELIDIGYLDENALIVRRRFDDIVSIVYNGRYPLTDAGERFYSREKRTLKGRMAGLIDRIHRRI